MNAALESPKSVSLTVIDDDLNISFGIEYGLRSLGCAIRRHTDPRKAMDDFLESPTDIVITDFKMPHFSGLDVLKCVKGASSCVEVIMVTGYADKGMAVEALQLGAFSLLEKPFSQSELVEVVKRTVSFRALQRERDCLSKQLARVTQQEVKRWGIDAFVGESQAIRDVIGCIRLLQPSQNTSVLITGESGTGKELVARAIHFGSSRATNPFVPVNCSAIPMGMAESLLFGHKKGSFTGAIADRPGFFEQADDGTVFLDEVGDMPAIIQAKLLRVLEDRVVVPVGATTGRRVNVRVIAATNIDLEAKIASGQFRSDLFYRLAAYPVNVPPLRSRPEDIRLLASHFCRSLSLEMGKACPSLEADAVAALEQYHFPGNAREMRNIIERALIECPGKAITAAQLSFTGLRASATPSAHEMERVALPDNLRAAEAILIRRAIEQAGGNLTSAARTLGVSRAKLYRLINSRDASLL